jgi:phosphate transport system permease protein
VSAAASSTSPFEATPRARRRKLVGRLMEAVCTLAALLAVVVLALVIYAVLRRGLPVLSWSFLTEVPTVDAFGNTSGGIANSIVGTLIITGIATLISVPIGVLIAIFNAEFAPARVANGIRLLLNVLAGVPTIVIGVFIFGLLVVGHGYSAYAASVALSIVMVPIIARSVEEVLATVPGHLREGSLALGATRAKTVVSVILPTATGGIVTATILAVARAAGETAPILFTSSIFANAMSTDPSKAMASLPMTIYLDSQQPSVTAQQQAWAAALVLMALVLLASIAGRLLSLRSRRRIEQSR